MEEHTPLQELEVRQGALEAMLDDQIPANEQVDFALHFLGWLENESKAAAAPFQEDMKSLMLSVTAATSPFDQAVGQIKNAIRSLLEEHYPDERHDSEVGRAQVVRPMTVRYDTKALEALRESSDANQRLLSPFREERASKPYLKVKVK